MTETFLKHTLCAVVSLAAITFTSCTKEVIVNNMDFPMMPDTMPGAGMGSDDGDAPDFDSTIAPYAGERADDAANDIAGTDEDIYWEANSFTPTVTVTYDGATATATSTDSRVICHTEGAYVTVDMLTNSVKNVEITASGSSGDGQLKIYGEKKFKLTLAGLNLTCSRGPAINNQCKKRMFVHLSDGSSNTLTDSEIYGEEPCYLNGATPADEDRKGCLFGEGNMIFSGEGVLTVEGRQKHGIASDGYIYLRPGVTIAVTDAAKNAIHAKGDAAEEKGIYMAGGLIYAHTSAEAGKCLKTDTHVEVRGGRLLLNTSGGSTYDAEEDDTSSAACVKTDGNVIIAGGTHSLKSTGTGGKGINADGSLSVSGGETTVTTTGGKYIYDEARDLTSSPKGVKADGDIDISGGSLNICVTGVSDGSEGLESKASITISGGSVYCYAYDDAINAATAINISGGRVYAYAVNNDGIDSNGSITIDGGLVIGIGTTAPESGIDCDYTDRFLINGGTVIGVGGSVQSAPSSSSRQRSVVYNGLSVSKGAALCLMDGSDKPVVSFQMPRSLYSMGLLVSSPAISEGSYYISTGGTLTGGTDSWNGWSEGASCSGGTQSDPFTVNGIVTTVGNSGFGGGGQPGGFPGGGQPGGGQPGGFPGGNRP